MREKFSNIDECLGWLEKEKFIRREMDLGLERIKLACQLLNHPESKQKTIHITGTNGKGSTVAFLASILQFSNCRVGTFTSPHLNDWNERIKVNNVPISNQEFFVATERILEKIKGQIQPTIFEFLTIVAFYYFAEINPCDIVIYEVGLGGKYDATNVILPLVCVITNIDYDHFRYLGNDLESIAAEKAGIIKNYIPCFTTENRKKILSLFNKIVQEKQSKLYKVNWPQKLKFSERDLIMSFNFSYQRNNLFLQTQMLGQHQIKNICLAVRIALFLQQNFPTINKHKIEKGIQKAFWPCRMELINKKPLLFIDGAHNHSGIKSLIKTVVNFFPSKKPIFLVAIMKDKQIEKMLSALKKVAHQIVFTGMPNPRQQEANKLRKNNTVQFHKIADCWEAFAYFYSLLNEKTIGIITGSLLFAAHIKSRWKKDKISLRKIKR